jgi:uncharacterized protein (TIGR02145 family)
MADWAAGSNESSIKNSILSWELSSSVPNFEKYVKNYWYANYDLGACNASLEGSIKSNPNGVNYICKGNAWARADEYERDTYQWVCSTQGEIKDGQVSGAKYICKGSDWVLASEFEIDTYKWVCSTEGEIKDGQASKAKYICKSKAWVLASEFEVDTYKWVCTEREVKIGQASGKKYVCKNKEWQTSLSYIEEKCFESNLCSTFKDARDNQNYFSVVIGEQTWMAENLNYNANSSKCFENNESNCVIYGRLYDWETAMVACPSGWHLPSDSDWNILKNYVQNDNESSGKYEGGRSCKYLQTTSGWGGDGGNGDDTYGFAAFPTGGFWNDLEYPDKSHPDGEFSINSANSTWWASSSTESDSKSAFFNIYYLGSSSLHVTNDNVMRLLGVRCIKD